MIELHHASNSAAMVLHILLEEKGAACERVPVDIAQQAHLQPGYL